MRLMVLLPVLLAACGGPAVYTQHRTLDTSETAPRVPETSLIPTDGAVLSDAEIARILDGEVTLSDDPRVVLVHLRHDSSHPSVDSSRSIPRAVGPQLIQRLRYSPKLEDASYLPAFLYSAAPTVAQLREAAARQQADLLFLFSTDCELHQALHAFVANEARAQCHADAALLDVRTGLVPFVSRAEETITLSESDDEFSIEETISRAEARGVDAAMRVNADALVRFLGPPSSPEGVMPEESK